ncbi:PDDEXK nuclease domain-containing protein [Chitinophaga vietnamensis]|uniref:PDDEXK nuclease domain-containing protein n=1 Tax=Chitinophaga vietnamensis TaxID=2593957 RepID=UPI001177D480|nr:PDDEXK nuclease domain-containing protein [Chitinophaga vietnamensis]
MSERDFQELFTHIQQTQHNVYKSINVELINLYWQVGEYINKKIAQACWGEKTVKELADYIAKKNARLKGFNVRGLYRMRLFYQTYTNELGSYKVENFNISSDNQVDIFVSTLLTQFTDIRNTLLVKISWSHHLLLLSIKESKERNFYLHLCIKEGYTVRELERQIQSSLFERVMLGKQHMPEALKQQVPASLSHGFKDSYVFEFLNLPETHSEKDLQKALVKKIKAFILELGKDFIFMGEEFRIQVGNKDFYIDLICYHRRLQCLVAFELKATDFMPEYLGKLNFYLEALDRDVKLQNENPSVGILLCKEKDNEVVEYALNRSLSPTIISEYKTLLPDKQLLQQKLHELFENELH